MTEHSHMRVVSGSDEPLVEVLGNKQRTLQRLMEKSEVIRCSRWLDVTRGNYATRISDFVSYVKRKDPSYLVKNFLDILPEDNDADLRDQARKHYLERPHPSTTMPSMVVAALCL